MRNLKTFAAIAAVFLTLAGAADAWPRRGGGGGGGGSFTTLDPNATTGTTPGIALTVGNLRADGPSSSFGRSISIGAFSGTDKGHFECTSNVTSGSGIMSLGVATAAKAIGPGGQSWVGGTDAQATGIYNNGGTFSTGTAGPFDTNLLAPSGQTIAVEADMTASPPQVWFARVGYRTPTSFDAPSGAPLHAYLGLDSPSGSWTCNFGASAWVVTPTPGFSAVLH